MPGLCLIAGPIRLSNGRAREFLGLKISESSEARITVRWEVVSVVGDAVEA
jgi:hypothetical protein